MSDEAVKADVAQPDTAERGENSQEAALVEDEKATKDDAAENGAGDEPSVTAADSAKPSSNLLKTKGQINHSDYKANSKFDASLLPETDDPAKIRTQVEFYFSDSNLPTDKYMWQMTGGEENKPMKLKTICGFKRMHRFKPYEAVVSALRDSDLLTISGSKGEEEVKRRKPYSVNRDRERELAATVYAKGFGDEQPSTQFEIEAWFANFGPINCIRLRRTPERLFKGSVFVEFQTEELAQEFLNLDPKPQWQGHELKIMTKKAYIEEKNQMIKDGKVEPSSKSATRFYEGKEIGSRGRGRGGRASRGRDRDYVDRDDWKKRRELDQKNGFRDRDGGHSRGRGRGGRGNRGRHDRDRRDRRDGEREVSDNGVERPAIQSSKLEKDETDNGAKPSEGSPEVEGASAGKELAREDVGSHATNGKRAREEDGDVNEPPAKRGDIKAEITTEAS